MKKLIFPVLSALLLLASCANEPTSFEDLRAAGEKGYVEGDYTKARGYLSKAVKLKGNDKRALYLLGMSYSKDYMLDSAFFFLKRADLLYPNDREINNGIYEVAPQLKEWQASISAMQVMINNGEDPVKLYPELIDYNLADSNFASAHYYFRKYKEADSLNPTRYLQLAGSAFQIDSLDMAIAVMDTAIAKFGPQDQFLSNKAFYLATKGDLSAAEVIYRDMVAKSPDNVTNRWNLANLLSSEKNPKKKQEALRIYTDIADKLKPELKVDSVIKALKAELGVKK